MSSPDAPCTPARSGTKLSGCDRTAARQPSRCIWPSDPRARSHALERGPAGLGSAEPQARSWFPLSWSTSVLIRLKRISEPKSRSSSRGRAAFRLSIFRSAMRSQKTAIVDVGALGNVGFARGWIPDADLAGPADYGGPRPRTHHHGRLTFAQSIRPWHPCSGDRAMRGQAILIALLAWGLSSCADYLSRHDTVTLAAGNSQKHNMLLQAAEPFNPSARENRIPTSGKRTALVMERYQGPPATSTGPSVTVNVKNGGGEPPCDFADQKDAAGIECGDRSAERRPGGGNP